MQFTDIVSFSSFCVHIISPFFFQANDGYLDTGLLRTNELNWSASLARRNMSLLANQHRGFCISRGEVIENRAKRGF